MEKMKEKEFNLSENILNHNKGGDEDDYFVLDIEDVKEFIKKLKNKLNVTKRPPINDVIDKLAGDKLI